MTCPSFALVWLLQTLLPLLTISWSFVLVMWFQHPERQASYITCSSWPLLLVLVAVWGLVPLILLLLLPMPGLYVLPASLNLVTLIVTTATFAWAKHSLWTHQQYTLWLEQRFQHHAQQCLPLLDSLALANNEIQHSSAMIMATLEQCTPIHVLSSAQPQELLSACTTSLPIASLSAIRTHVHQLQHLHNYLAPRNMTSTCSTSSQSLQPHPFDMGDLLQSVGDALAGTASKLQVNLVLYHVDNNMHHTRVLGEEAILRHTLFTLLLPILHSCIPGAFVELGLNIHLMSPNSSGQSQARVTIEVIRTMHLASPLDDLLQHTTTAPWVQQVGVQVSLRSLSSQKTRVDIVLTLPLVMEDKDATSSSSALGQEDGSKTTLPSRTEPTLKELMAFVEQLKGVRMILHAREQSVFAKHMTGCLASWNCDISHVPVEQKHDLFDTGSAASSSKNTTPDTEVTHLATASDHRPPNSNINNSTSSSAPVPTVPSPANEEDHLLALPPAFILIDDHIPTLEHVLDELRAKPSALSPGSRRHRTSKSSSSSHHPMHSPHHPASGPLAHQHPPHYIHHLWQHPYHHHHPSSSANPTTSPPAATYMPVAPRSTAILFFASLSNYKRVRETIQHAMVWSYASIPMPRIVVIPKPAGPRRYLTAFHTAWHNVMVHQPHVMPIATSPSSPYPSGQVVFPPGMHPSPPCFPTSDTVNDLHIAWPGSTNLSPSSHLGMHDAQYLLDRSPTTSPNVHSKPLRRRPSHNDHHDATGPGDHFSAGATPTNLTPNADMNAILELDASSANMLHNGSNSNTSTPLANDLQDKVTTPPTIKEPSEHTKSLSRIKLNKRRKKERGSAFANTVSPPINVLIVEDNMINQAILSAWMKKHKINFSVAGNGKEAVEKWKEGGFHLILMDIQLPVMDGIQATKIIRSIEKEEKIGVLPMSSSFLQRQLNLESSSPVDTEPPTSASSSSTPTEQPSDQLPDAGGRRSSHTKLMPSTFRSPVIIVALTASSLESDRHAALAAGCNDFLTKPISLEWLEKKIIEWGCMQALIDFDGWRLWKRSNDQQELQPGKPSSSSTPGLLLGKDHPPLSSSPPSLTTNEALPTSTHPSPTTPASSVQSRRPVSPLVMDTPLAPPLYLKQESAAPWSSSQFAQQQQQQTYPMPPRNGIMLPGAIGLSKQRRYSTLTPNHKQSTPPILPPFGHSPSASAFPVIHRFKPVLIQKSNSETTLNANSVRRHVAMKKAASMDDTLT
ncbi:hypothetical protein DM01DRAFT_1334049 [Hesseltinella vesiculosa]|uniref:Response regulatory domain-containing protein n=1 Tax=Hesseltinella vesiculosa TaxID=101127 RepID=A0A1X2GMU9_9FUNG|nr:hypothetical protein DM01DRAFT_1334049 [Hesseltinella vesiculosa]